MQTFLNVISNGTTNQMAKDYAEAGEPLTPFVKMTMLYKGLPWYVQNLVKGIFRLTGAGRRVDSL